MDKIPVVFFSYNSSMYPINAYQEEYHCNFNSTSSLFKSAFVESVKLENHLSTIIITYSKQ